MKRLERVLAAVDFSEAGRAAFDHAVALSVRHDAELTVVHAVPSEYPFRWHGRERRDLITSLRAAATAAGVRFRISVQSGDPAGVILLHARSRDVDVIVMGAGERSAFERFRLGSVAETVADEATQPVLVVPYKPGAVARPATKLESIVVAVDLGEGSKAAVERALSIAGSDTRVTVVHALPALSTQASSFRYQSLEPEYQRELARDAWSKIAELIPARSAGPAVHARVVTGEPAAEIARVARESNADLILVGSTRQGAIGRWLFGTTAARLMRTGDVPVLSLAA